MRDLGLSEHNQTAASARGTAISIGNFDGCHRGHQSLFRSCLELAERHKLISVAYTFTPHPRTFFHLQSALQPLFTDAQKERYLKEFGFQSVLLQTFDKSFAAVTHDDYYNRILRKDLYCRALVVGEDFRFGEGRKGDVKYLAAVTARDGVMFHVAPPETAEGQIISTSRIRDLLSKEGGVEAAHAMLGHPYTVEGVIERGLQKGAAIGFPTANFRDVHQVLPANGVYAGWMWVEGLSGGQPTLKAMAPDVLPAAINVGLRPTVQQDQASPNLEAHIIDAPITPGALYGRRAAVYLLHRLREERRFAGLTELTDQIKKDVVKAKELLGANC